MDECDLFPALSDRLPDGSERFPYAAAIGSKAPERKIDLPEGRKTAKK
jgi:hypothetical protein